MKNKKTGFYKSQKIKKRIQNKNEPVVTAKAINQINYNTTDEAFKSMLNSTLSNVGTDPELIEILEGVYTSLNRGSNRNQNKSIVTMTLFSVVSEVFYLNKDKQTRMTQKQKSLSNKIHDCANNIRDLKIQKTALQENYDLARYDFEDTTPDRVYEDKIFNKVEKVLEPKDWPYLNKIKSDIAKIDIKIRKEYASQRAFKDSKELYMYAVSENGKTVYEMTAHLMKANEKLGSILRENGLSTSVVELNIKKGKMTTGKTENSFNVFSKKIAQKGNN